MPFDRKRYPTDWEAISLARRESAGWACEWCGARQREPHPITGSRVILTVAHVENDDPMDVRPENLAALCQRCHNRHDLPMRRIHAAETKRRRKIEAGQIEMVTM